MTGQTYYGGRLFRLVSVTGQSDTSSETIFQYSQKGNVVTAEYSGGNIHFGHLIGIINTDGNFTARYQHVTDANKLMTGICETRHEMLEGNKMRLHEKWQWTSGDKSSGTSVLEEI